MTFDFIDRRDYEEVVETERIAAIWTDGPDSEAARAFRGDGTRAQYCWLSSSAVRWAAAEFSSEAARAKLGATFHGGGLHDASVFNVLMHAARKLEAMADLLDMRDTPDPSHTPAVRRVVAWEVKANSELQGDRGAAYERAAWLLLVRSAHTPGCWRRVLDWAARAGNTQRLAAYLRHRDEKAGCR